jgi:hypothetical protein
MRAVILVLILVVVAAIVLIATGLIDINQVRGARAPDVDVSRNGVTASGGQAPAFDVETGTVSVGTRDANVKVPQLSVNPAGNDAAAQNQVNQAAPVNGM